MPLTTVLRRHAKTVTFITPKPGTERNPRKKFSQPFFGVRWEAGSTSGMVLVQRATSGQEPLPIDIVEGGDVPIVF